MMPLGGWNPDRPTAPGCHPCPDRHLLPQFPPPGRNPAEFQGPGPFPALTPGPPWREPEPCSVVMRGRPTLLRGEEDGRSWRQRLRRSLNFPGIVEGRHSMLSLDQAADIAEWKQRFGDVFSPVPGRTLLIDH
ncbi:hypothetical protein NHX12_004989 [Muraenolepis orangiensis]|uniref:Uncharacterized protein n=1 Tax=Muraenolepis orangiensis TaxID=630683 RepID=A0A9Q0DW91_9TELE|nr:hypothetical protein NHX12_004989 [Muraenolepis orangiensis]